MAGPAPFSSSPDDTHTEMLEATYTALQKHGYADLTIQRIGEEFPKSKSLIYQHYDGKDELLVALLEFLHEQFKDDVPDEGFADAGEHLEILLDHALPASLDSERAAFSRAMTELRAQAPHDAAFREQFTRTDRFFRKHISDIVRDGMEQDIFQEVDPDRTATFVATIIHGTRNKRMTTDDEARTAAVRQELEEYVQTHLLTGDDQW